MGKITDMTGDKDGKSKADGKTPTPSTKPVDAQIDARFNGISDK